LEETMDLSQGGLRIENSIYTTKTMIWYNILAARFENFCQFESLAINPYFLSGLFDYALNLYDAINAINTGL